VQAANYADALMELPDVGENAISAMPMPHKLWLILTTTAKLGQRACDRETSADRTGCRDHTGRPWDQIQAA